MADNEVDIPPARFVREMLQFANNTYLMMIEMKIRIKTMYATKSSRSKPGSEGS